MFDLNFEEITKNITLKSSKILLRVHIVISYNKILVSK